MEVSNYTSQMAVFCLWLLRTLIPVLCRCSTSLVNFLLGRQRVSVRTEMPIMVADVSGVISAIQYNTLLSFAII